MTHERHLLAKHDPLYGSGTVQRNNYQERSYQGQHGTRNLETTDVWEEVSAETGTHKSVEEQRAETAATKQEGIQQYPQEHPRAGDRETSGRDS
jgi:hypothetical protein